MENRRILITDDNTEIHGGYKKILLFDDGEEGSKLSSLSQIILGSTTSSSVHEKADYVIDSAYQGSEALEMVKAAEAKGAPYALVFMDVRMPPGWDGIETTKKILEAVPNTE